MNRIRSIAAFAVLSGGLWAAGARADMDNSCRWDVLKFCKGVEPGEGRIARCLRGHKDQVSEGCKQAVRQARPAQRTRAGKVRDSDGQDKDD